MQCQNICQTEYQLVVEERILVFRETEVEKPNWGPAPNGAIHGLGSYRERFLEKSRVVMP